MAGNKIVDLDPTRRLSKAALTHIQKEINDLKYEDVSGITVLVTPKTGNTAVYAYGLDFEALGIGQSILTALGQQMLIDQFEEHGAE